MITLTTKPRENLFGECREWGIFHPLQPKPGATGSARSGSSGSTPPPTPSPMLRWDGREPDAGHPLHSVVRLQSFDPTPHDIHINHGHCRRGRITNLFGTCYDDLLALNADDGYRESPIMGPIEDIVVDGIFSENCHSAARILTTGSPIRNITIRNVHDSFYRYAIGFTHFFPDRKTPGLFENITLESLSIRDCSMENHLPDTLPFMRCQGAVRDLRVDGLRLRSVPGAGPSLDGLPAAREPAAVG